jgi:protein-disulfide isomerase
VLVGGVAGIGVVALFALLIVSLSGNADSANEPGRNNFIQNFCDSNEENCIEEGDEAAPVTLVEVSDYGCGHCRDFNREKSAVLKSRYVDSGQMRWVVMPFALQNQGGQFPTLPSAVSALCAEEQGRFSDYHEALFELQETTLFNNEQGFMTLAEELDLDTDSFASCLEDNEYNELMLRNAQAAQSAGLRSTPTFYINGRLIEGNYPNVSDYQRVIDEELGS